MEGNKKEITELQQKVLLRLKKKFLINHIENSKFYKNKLEDIAIEILGDNYHEVIGNNVSNMDLSYTFLYPTVIKIYPETPSLCIDVSEEFKNNLRVNSRFGINESNANFEEVNFDELEDCKDIYTTIISNISDIKEDEIDDILCSLFGESWEQKLYDFVLLIK